MNKLLSRTALALLLAVSLLGSGCATTGHPTQPATTGAPASWARVEAQLSNPGPIHLTRVVAADWKIPLKGLVNLDHPKSRGAHLKDHPEPIQVYVYVLRHPTRGTFLIDSGIARSVAEQRDDMPVRWPVRGAMPMDDLKVHKDTKALVAELDSPLSGVFLTHLHLDHILGLTDIPRSVPLYVGPEETRDLRFLHLLDRATTNANLEGFGSLRELPMQEDEEAPLPYWDVLGDQSLIAFHAPGHTRGNLSFLIRADDGAHLLVGDASHTCFGWDNGVEPGTFNTDGDQAAASLKKLRTFAAAHPDLTIHLGHQSW